MLINTARLISILSCKIVNQPAIFWILTDCSCGRPFSSSFKYSAWNLCFINYKCKICRDYTNDQKFLICMFPFAKGTYILTNPDENLWSDLCFSKSIAWYNIIQAFVLLKKFLMSKTIITYQMVNIIKKSSTFASSIFMTNSGSNDT